MHVLPSDASFHPTSKANFYELSSFPLSDLDILDRVDFLAGQFFDVRLEVHAPVNGSEANGGVPDPNFTFTIGKKGAAQQNASTFFKVAEPRLETWNFTWFEGQ